MNLKNIVISNAVRVLRKSPEIVQEKAVPLEIKYQFKKAERYFQDQSVIKKRSSEFQNEVKAFWKKHLGIRINPAWHFIYANFTGKEDVRFLSKRVWLDHIHDTLNDPSYLSPVFRDKNFTDFIIDKKYLPKTVFKVVRGRFYDDENSAIDQKKAFLRLHSDEEDKILKPSKGLKGIGVRKLEVQGKTVYLDEKEITADQLMDFTGEDAIVQYRVKQHSSLDEVHASSLNTVRIYTIRLQNKIHNLSSVMKFGGNGDTADNTNNGYLRGVNEDGSLRAIIYDRKLSPVERHGTTGFDFQKLKNIPAFEEALLLCKKSHEKILHLDFAGWDVAITKEGKPLIIEVNSNPTVEVFQLINQRPMFEDFTEEVIHFARDRDALSRQRSSFSVLK
ncbi:MAG: hypothetical protein JJU13_19650 [Balneolaceae bacterium]|nr:hypothetical protein [Balneolaceae bacterium]